MGCCCNKKSKVQSCGCKTEDDFGTFNIVIPNNDFDPRECQLNMSATGDASVFLDADFSAWYDRISCEGDITVSFSTNDVTVDKIFVGFPGVNEFTSRVIPSYQSTAVVGDLYIRFVGVPAPGTVVTFFVTHEGCGTKKVQTGTAVIP